MLSRRSVRVKVMQLLYTQDRDDSITVSHLLKSYQPYIDLSYELFLFSLYVIEQICSCSTEDMIKRHSKHLPLDYDKKFTDKLVTNPIISSIKSNNYLQKIFEKKKFESKINKDYLSKIYDAFAKSDEYKNFILEETDNEGLKELLLEMYRFCRQNEYFNEVLEDSYYNWLDDKSLIVGAVKKYIKGLPSDNEKMFEEFIPDNETVDEFGYELLKKSLNKKEELMEIIIPVLENWDHERLAIVDTILLRMALCEMMDFSTIPSKVTLNEYVELAKQYSTAKSKEFVNGILDKLMKNIDGDEDSNSESEE